MKDLQVFKFDIQRFAVNGTNLDDIITNTIGSVAIYSYYGNDLIRNLGKYNSIIKYVTIDAGNGSDTIDNWHSSNSFIDGGEGQDSIENYGGDYVTINGGSGNEHIINFGNHGLIFGDSGDDYIDNSGGQYVKISGGSGNDKIFTTQYGKDDGKYVTVDGNEGDDHIFHYCGNNVSLNGGSGNDTIEQEIVIFKDSGWEGKNATINGGIGNDSIVLDGDSNNVIQYASGDGSDTIDGINSSDTIKITGEKYEKVTISSSNDVTLKVGSGSILVKNGKNINFKIDGTVSGGNTAIFTNNADYYSNSKSNTVLNALLGNDTVINSATNVTINGDSGADSIKNSAQNVVIDGGADNDSIYNFELYAKITGGSGDDYIYNRYGLSSTIEAGVGNDTIFNEYSDSGKIDAGEGNDSIFNNSYYVTIDGGAGSDSIFSYGSSLKINSGSGDDKIYNSASYVTITGGTGNDSVSLSSSANNNIIKYSTGDGNDTVSGYDSNDTISLSGGYYTRETIGTDVRVSLVSGGAMTLSGASGKTINIVGGTLSIPAAFTNNADYYSNSKSNTVLNALLGNDTVINSASNVTINGDSGADSIKNSAQNVVINGGADSDKIYNSASYVTITGGTGNDSVSLSANANKNLIKYASGDGKDTIYGLNADDTISITSGSYTTAISGQDVIVNVDSGSMILKDAKGKNVTIYPTIKPVTIVTQQEVIKKFMAVLDTVTSSGVAAVSKAVSVASDGLYGNVYDAIEAMVSECKKASSSNDFLLNYCGIDLSNTDTGAITGKDAGGSTTKTATSIVPENPNISLKNCSKNSFAVNSLNIYLKDKSVSSLTKSEKYIWDGLYTWWVEGGLNLIAESYGDNYSFGLKSSATNKSLYVKFYNEYSNVLSYINPVQDSNGKTISFEYGVNMYYYDGIDDSDPNGSTSSGQTYYDRVAAHELTHATMASNINYFRQLPFMIIEGTAELVHGIDEQRTPDIKTLAGNATLLQQALCLLNGYNLSVPGLYAAADYAGGYMFLRWLAKKSSDWSTNPLSQLGTTGSNLASQTLGGNGSYNDITTNGNTVTVAKSFNGSRIDLTAFDSTVTKVNATALTKGIWIIGNERANSIAAGSGADSISGNTGNDTISGGNGNDVIMGDAGNDTLFGDAGNDTLSGGSGKNNLTGGAGNDLFIHNGGNDVITDYEVGKDKIQIANGYINNSSISGSNVVFTTMNGTITVIGSKGKKITLVDQDGRETTQVYPSVTPETLPSGWKYGNTAKTNMTASVTSAANVDLTQSYGTSVVTVDGSKITTGRTFTGNAKANSIKGGTSTDIIYGNAGADTLYGGSGNDKIYGGNDSDKVYGDAGNDSLYGNSGNDTLTGGAGNDTFFYETGNDVIADYVAGTDKIKLVSSAITSSSISGSNVILKTSNGNITVQNAKGKKITVIDKNGKETTQVYPDPTPTLPSGWKYGNTAKTNLTASVTSAANVDLTQSYGTSVATVDGSKITTGRTFTGNAKANSIKGGTSADIIYGNAGADILYGSSGNDKIYGGNDSDKVYGDAGNDSLYGNSGNDTLTGGAGNDTFFYETGNDTITDYTAGQDKIKITNGKISKTTYSGNNVVFTVGNGSITVQNGKNKKITIIDSSNKTTTQTYARTLDLLYDNNFITDEFGIDDIYEVTDNNYSVGKFENVTNNAQICSIDSIASASYTDEK